MSSKDNKIAESQRPPEGEREYISFIWMQKGSSAETVKKVPVDKLEIKKHVRQGYHQVPGASTGKE